MERWKLMRVANCERRRRVEKNSQWPGERWCHQLRWELKTVPGLKDSRSSCHGEETNTHTPDRCCNRNILGNFLISGISITLSTSSFAFSINRSLNSMACWDMRYFSICWLHNWFVQQHFIYSYISYKYLLLSTTERILLVHVNIWESVPLFCQISMLVLGNHHYSR